MAEAIRPMIGDPKHLAFEIAWTQEPADARGLGWGALVVWFAGRPVWASEAQGQPVAWTWIDLVEHLARAWGHLLYEEVYPFGLTAADPEELRARARLARVPGKTANEVEDAVHAFQHRHDLAAGLKGIDLSPIWLVREGMLMRIRAEKRDLWRPCDEVLATLTALVDAVRARTVAPAARAKTAFERWDAREPGRELVLRLQTGLSTEDLRRWAPQDAKNPLAWWGTTATGPQRTSSGRARRASGRQLSYMDMIRVDDTPLRAVARLSQSLAESTRIMDRQRSLPLAEVFGGATPLHLEQRARAFAAELLLPREVAGLQVRRASSLEQAAKALRRSCGVSTEVVGWQIRNGPGWEWLDAVDRKVVAAWLRRWGRASRRLSAEPRSPVRKVAAKHTQNTRATVTPVRAHARGNRSPPQRGPR